VLASPPVSRASAPRIATIGVYGFTAETFIAALRRAGATAVFDVRQRRGVRGSEYAWANSQRLQAALADAGLDYSHLPELAPTTELRALQYREDDRVGVGKRSRVELAAEYRERYGHEILDRVDLAEILARAPAAGFAALMCVERDPRACHRSVVAERLAREHGATVVDILPD
jgi:uncharacterized protein (DUF488 family)